MEIHPNFKLNGTSFTREELLEVGYSLIKEGAPFEVGIGDFLLDWLGNAKSILVNTSGSTSTPKTISLTKEHMANSALATGRYFALSAKDSALLCLPATYIAGKMMLVRAMVLGLELDCVAPGSQPLRFLEKVYDFAAMVPMQVENSLSQLSQIRTLIIGGAPVSLRLQEKLRSYTTKIYETYGMTETISHIAVKPIGSTYFEAMPEVVLNLDERDCLVISAPHVGALELATNDVVELHTESEFLWLGRYDYVINSGGIKIFPEQLEAKLNGLITSRFFITGLPDQKLGRKVTLIFEGDQDPEHLKKQILSHSALSKYEVPKAFFGLSKFKDTKNGKLDRKQTLLLLDLE